MSFTGVARRLVSADVRACSRFGVTAHGAAYETMVLPGMHRYWCSHHLPDWAHALVFGVRTCRVCGCNDGWACGAGCSWVPDAEQLGDLCSACAPLVQRSAVTR